MLRLRETPYSEIADNAPQSLSLHFPGLPVRWPKLCPCSVPAARSLPLHRLLEFVFGQAGFTAQHVPAISPVFEGELHSGPGRKQKKTSKILRASLRRPKYLQHTQQLA